MRKKPRKLSLELQHSEIKQSYQDVVDDELNIVMEKSQLRTLCLTGDAIHLIINCAIIRHATNTGTLIMNDLNKFHPLIDRSNLHGIGCPDFAICKRKNNLTIN